MTAAIRYNPPGNWPRAGRAFNHGVVEPSGRRVHVTGQVAWDPDHTIVGGDDPAAQMERCILGIRNVLEPMGGQLSDIVSMTVYFLRDEDVPALQKVRAAHFPAETAPASIFIKVPGLIAPGLLVELVPIAVIPEDRFTDPNRG